MIRLIAYSGAIIALIASPTAAALLKPAFSPSGGFEIDAPRDPYVGSSQGINFVTSSALLVDAIGVYDTGSDGLANPWQVALFDVGSRNLLRVVDIPAGKTGTVRVDNFRYVPIAPIRLEAGVLYQLASYNHGRNGDLIGVVGENGFTLGASSDLSVVGAFRHSRINLGQVTFAEYAFGVYVFGGSFLYQPIPEPTTALTAMLGVLLAGCQRKMAGEA